MLKELVFYYSSMNSGKSLALLNQNYTLKSKGFATHIAKPAFDTRTDKTIETRLGNVSEKCTVIEKDRLLSEKILKSKKKKPDYILVDEAQFLSVEQVRDLSHMVDNWGIGVAAYGLKINHLGEFFDGSKELMKISDHLIAIPNICAYNKGAPAFFHIKTKGDLTEGSEVGSDDMYESVSRKKWLETTDFW